MKVLRIDLQTDDVSVEKYKKWSLDQICNMFDWNYKIITNKQATQYE